MNALFKHLLRIGSVVTFTIGYLLNLSVCVFLLVFFSNVLGAYASFLWEINDEDDDEVDDDAFGDRTRQGKEDFEV